MTTTVRARQLVKVAPDQVYYAFTHATALHEWLCDFATVAPRPGGRMYLWWHGDFYSAGEYVSLQENKSITFTWFGRGEPAASQVRVTFKPLEGGTQVVIAHSVPDGKKWETRAEGFRHEWQVSLENLAAVLETGLDKRTLDRPMLGIGISDFSAEIAKTMGVPVKAGLRLDSLAPEMGAARAGLCHDDVLVKLDGKPLTNDFGSLVLALQGKKGGDQVEVVFYRGPEKKTARMELTKRPIPQIPWEPAELAKRLRAKYDEVLAALEKVFAGVSQSEADYHPAPGEWSANEVLAHLLQNERLWLDNLDDLIGGYERLADDWGGNIAAHMTAIVSAYQTTRGLLDELQKLSYESVALAAALPPEFIARKSSYFTAVNNMLEGLPSHSLSHIDQIKNAIAAARQKE